MEIKRFDAGMYKVITQNYNFGIIKKFNGTWDLKLHDSTGTKWNFKTKKECINHIKYITE